MQSPADASRFVFPPPLAPGDLVAIVAPSSPFPTMEFLRGLAWLRGRYRLRASPGIFERARDSYLAGDDERRGAELAAAMRDAEVKAIVAARGGYGAMRILDALPWDAFAAQPKWLVGFSDVTALHVEASRRGVASIHAPHVTGLGASPTTGTSVWTRAAWMAALERPRDSVAWRGLRVLREGRADGPLFGGNLALLEAMAAAGRLVVPAGAVLAIEDVTERPYRVDRMLTSLALGGHLARASAIVLGEFAQCEPGPDGRVVFDVLADRTRGLGVPVLAGAPFGHGGRNDAFVLGARARVEGDAVTIGR